MSNLGDQSSGVKVRKALRAELGDIKIDDKAGVMAGGIKNELSNICSRLDGVARQVAKDLGVPLPMDGDGAVLGLVVKYLSEVLLDPSAEVEAKVRATAAKDLGMLCVKLQETTHKISVDRAKLALEASRMDMARAQVRLALLAAESRGGGMTQTELARRAGISGLIDINELIEASEAETAMVGSDGD